MDSRAILRMDMVFYVGIKLWTPLTTRPFKGFMVHIQFWDFGRTPILRSLGP